MPEFEGEISVDGHKFKVKGEFNSMGTHTREPEADAEVNQRIRAEVYERILAGTETIPSFKEVITEAKKQGQDFKDEIEADRKAEPKP